MPLPPQIPNQLPEWGDINQNEIVKQGWLLKQSRYLQTWRRRWFVLTPWCLCSFRSADYRGVPTEILVLKDCTTVKSADEEVQRPNAFRVDTNDRVFFLLAESPEQKENWIGAIGRQMVQPSSIQEFHEEDILY